MAGRIREEDIATVREKARIDDVIGTYVTLRNAGGGNMKGLCPFHDEKSPSFNVTPSRGMFHCLAGETEVLTWEGPRPIRELAGGTHRILGARADWIDAPFKSYGVQPLLKITMTRNRQVKEIFATDQHRWFVRSESKSRSRREVVTKDLKTGDRLAYTYPRNSTKRTTPSPFGIAHGFTFGDGTRNGTGTMALICPPKDEAMLKWFPNSVTSASGDNLLVHHLPRFFKDVPSLDESHPYLLGWLAGYFAADGCVAADGTVILNSADRSHLEFVRTLCSRLGIATYGITTQRRMGIHGVESDLHRVHLVNADLSFDFFLIDEHRRRFEETEKKFARLGWVVQSIETTDRVEEVFCAEVEDGHAFTLADNILTGNCFGCGVGGDVIKFVMDMDGLSFSETVERLADKAGVELRYEDGPGPARNTGGPQRPRLVEAHKLAAAYYVEQLGSADAMQARQFLDTRGFDKDAAEHFGVGFSPRSGEDLTKYLRGMGFTDDELVTSGLSGRSDRGLYDRFRGRLMWPIRDASGDVVGFGARRIFDDDRIAAKYLNTSETPIYKKSQVLYGIDLARREIARASQAVIVEGYTDVMACHLAGVKTAVATCGTAFGDDHSRVIRRLLQDHDEFRGEVIFTFDGDEAGQKAALRAFEGDQNFAGQTYVAVEPSGLDPCDLRLEQGDEAVRELVARRVPLYRFVLANVVARYDLDRADGRIDALREAAKLVTAIRDRSKVDAFAREVAGMLGIDPTDVQREVRRAANRSQHSPQHAGPGAPPAQPAADPQNALPDPRDPRYSLERETLKLVVQVPDAIAPALADVSADDFTHPAYRAVWAVVTLAGGVAAADSLWASRLQANTADERVQSLLSALSVEAVHSAKEPDAPYAAQHVHRLRELTVMRRIADLKSKLQRTNPVDDATEYNRMFGELVALEQHRRALRELALDSSS
ncbi:MAG TPA: DNA primase [Marmoricola sp.]|nr:DNA primase [Marmoricola sp.]